MVYDSSTGLNLDHFSWGLIFFLMFSQVLFMSLLSYSYSKAANLFEILIWYCSLTSSSLIFLRLHFPTSNFCALNLLTANLSLNFVTTNSDQYHSELPWKICILYNWMSYPIYQNVNNLDVSLPFRRVLGLLMNVSTPISGL